MAALFVAGALAVQGASADEVVAPSVTEAVLSANNTVAQGNDARKEWILLLGGNTGPNSSYAFLGALTPLGATSNLGNGTVLKLWADQINYRYTVNVNGINQTFDATAPGAEILIGWVNSDDRNSTGFYIGPQYRNTSTNDPNSDVVGGRIGAKGEFIGNYRWSENFGFQPILSYTTSDQSYYARARFGLGPKTGFRWGPEAVFRGNPDYTATQFGLFLDGIALGENSELSVSGGVENSNGTSAGSTAINGGYFGLSLLFKLGR